MNLSITRREGAQGSVTLTLVGDLDVYTAPTLREVVIELHVRGVRHLIFDLNGLEYLDSTGLGVMVGALKRLRSVDGTLMLVCTEERILKIFRITGLVKVYLICSSIRQAEEMRRWKAAGLNDELESGDWIPVRLYLREARGHEAVEAALREVVKAYGFEVNYEFLPRFYSYWKELGIRFRRRSASSAEIEQRFHEVEGMIRAALSGDLPLGADPLEAKTVVELIRALENTSDAVIQYGALLLVKTNDTLLARVLSPLEIIHLERHPVALRDPEFALHLLQELVDRRLPVHVHGAHPRTGTVHLDD